MSAFCGQREEKREVDLLGSVSLPLIHKVHLTLC